MRRKIAKTQVGIGNVCATGIAPSRLISCISDMAGLTYCARACVWGWVAGVWIRTTSSLPPPPNRKALLLLCEHRLQGPVITKYPIQPHQGHTSSTRFSRLENFTRFRSLELHRSPRRQAELRASPTCKRSWDGIFEAWVFEGLL